MLAAIAIFSVLLLVGCGKEDPELAKYKEEMQGCHDRINALVIDIEGIDLNSEDRAEILLECLDQMNEEFSYMATLEVPSEFANVEELADEASANLSRAVSLYHQAFDYPDGYDPSLVQAAQEYYSRAFRRLSYIGTIMQGEIPQDEHVTIVGEDEGEPSDAGEPSDGDEPDGGIQDDEGTQNDDASYDEGDTMEEEAEE